MAANIGREAQIRAGYSEVFKSEINQKDLTKLISTISKFLKFPDKFPFEKVADKQKRLMKIQDPYDKDNISRYLSGLSVKELREAKTPYGKLLKLMELSAEEPIAPAVEEAKDITEDVTEDILKSEPKEELVTEVVEEPQEEMAESIVEEPREEHLTELSSDDENIIQTKEKQEMAENMNPINAVDELKRELTGGSPLTGVSPNVEEKVVSQGIKQASLATLKENQKDRLNWAKNAKVTAIQVVDIDRAKLLVKGAESTGKIKDPQSVFSKFEKAVGLKKDEESGVVTFTNVHGMLDTEKAQQMYELLLKAMEDPSFRVPVLVPKESQPQKKGVTLVEPDGKERMIKWADLPSEIMTNGTGFVEVKSKIAETQIYLKMATAKNRKAATKNYVQSLGHGKEVLKDPSVAQNIREVTKNVTREGSNFKSALSVPYTTSIPKDNGDGWKKGNFHLSLSDVEQLEVITLPKFVDLFASVRGSQARYVNTSDIKALEASLNDFAELLAVEAASSKSTLPKTLLEKIENTGDQIDAANTAKQMGAVGAPASAADMGI